MNKRDITLADLFARAAGKPGAEIVIGLLLMPDYSEFVRLVNQAIDMALRRMAENPELRKDRTEDELTIELVTLLRQIDIDAHHEAKVGGHCDVSIRGPSDYLWLAEAKRDNQGLDWLYKGFQQLCTRYSTGLPNQNHGGLILYLYAPNIVARMNVWQNHLKETHKKIEFAPCDVNALSFISTHVHERAGMPYCVRHIPLSLHFEPKDQAKKALKKPRSQSSSRAHSK